jgi:hypothetical protein
MHFASRRFEDSDRNSLQKLRTLDRPSAILCAVTHVSGRDNPRMFVAVLHHKDRRAMIRRGLAM